jgi:quaternary ammonium compound-resistance protein SugE
MAWVALIVSGLFETVWAAALAESKGFTRPGPVVVFVLGLIASIVGLSYALRELPVGTGYTIWVGIGAVGTGIYGMVALGEPVTALRLLCLSLIVGGVVGLKLLS